MNNLKNDIKDLRNTLTICGINLFKNEEILKDMEQLRIIQQEIYVLGSEICRIENYVNVIIDEMERFSDSQHTQNKINRTEKNITDVNARLNKLDLKINHLNKFYEDLK